MRIKTHLFTLEVFSVLSLLLMIALLSVPCHAQVKEDFKQAFPIVPNGQFRLSNINGTVVIKAWEELRVQIIAVKEAPSADRMSELKIEIAATADSIEVETIYPQGKGSGFSVNYEVSLPKTVALQKINTVNGKIDITGMASEVHISTVNGDGKIIGCSGRVEGQTVNGGLQVVVGKGQILLEANLSTVNGSLRLIAPDLADARVQANTVNGSIQTDFPFEVKGKLVGKSMEGSLGNGSAGIKLKTVNGSIHLLKTTS